MLLRCWGLKAPHLAPTWARRLLMLGLGACNTVNVCVSVGVFVHGCVHMHTRVCMCECSHCAAVAPIVPILSPVPAAGTSMRAVLHPCPIHFTRVDSEVTAHFMLESSLTLPAIEAPSISWPNTHHQTYLMAKHPPQNPPRGSRLPHPLARRFPFPWATTAHKQSPSPRPTLPTNVAPSHGQHCPLTKPFPMANTGHK